MIAVGSGLATVPVERERSAGHGQVLVEGMEMEQDGVPDGGAHVMVELLPGPSHPEPGDENATVLVEGEAKYARKLLVGFWKGWNDGLGTGGKKKRKRAAKRPKPLIKGQGKLTQFLKVTNKCTVMTGKRKCLDLVVEDDAGGAEMIIGDKKKLRFDGNDRILETKSISGQG